MLKQNWETVSRKCNPGSLPSPPSRQLPLWPKRSHPEVTGSDTPLRDWPDLLHSSLISPHQHSQFLLGLNFGQRCDIQKACACQGGVWTTQTASMMVTLCLLLASPCTKASGANKGQGWQGRTMSIPTCSPYQLCGLVSGVLYPLKRCWHPTPQYLIWKWSLSRCSQVKIRFLR